MIELKQHGFVTAKIVTRQDGSYLPDDKGELAALLPVHDRDGHLVDISAWFEPDGSAWWLRHRDQAVILGAQALAVAAFHGDSIGLSSTPRAWLLGGRRGACVLRWDVDVRLLFEGIARVDCDSAMLRDRLAGAFRRGEPLLTTRSVRHAA